MAELTLTDQNFEQEVIKSDKPVLVDFWSPMCAPCLVMGPIIEEIAKEFEGKIKVGKLNVSENLQIARGYGVRAIPTFIIFRNGQEIERIIGARPKQFLVDKLNSYL
ncbi:thioredoxin [Patescibacteria group bacterium]|nr:thioredoxin [Patescibacteria group bacterium]